MHKLAMLVAASILLASPALAHEDSNAKGPNGGPIKEVAGVHVEFVSSGTTVMFTILDEKDKPIAAKGHSGAALIVSGSERETVKLSDAGNALKGEARKAIPSGATVTLQLSNAAGKSGQARFTR